MPVSTRLAFTVLSSVLLVEPLASAQSAGGQLVVLSTPPGATVSLDGSRVGRTTLTLHDVVPGDHLLDTSWPDGSTASVIVKVAAGTSTVVRLSPGMTGTVNSDAAPPARAPAPPAAPPPATAYPPAPPPAQYAPPPPQYAPPPAYPQQPQPYQPTPAPYDRPPGYSSTPGYENNAPPAPANEDVRQIEAQLHRTVGDEYQQYLSSSSHQNGQAFSEYLWRRARVRKYIGVGLTAGGIGMLVLGVAAGFGEFVAEGNVVGSTPLGNSPATVAIIATFGSLGIGCIAAGGYLWARYGKEETTLRWYRHGQSPATLSFDFGAGPQGGVVRGTLRF